jgi:outer membrane protein insertion porin family
MWPVRNILSFRAFVFIAGAFALAAVFLCLPGSLRCQSSGSATYRLAGLKFDGLSRVSEAQIVSFTGLKKDDKVTTDQLLAIQKRLSKSGVFDDVAYNFKTLGPDLTVEFDFTESANLARCVFDNFIWFSNDDLDKTLRANVALYNGAVPASGTTLQDAINALQTVVRTKAPAAKIDFTPFADSPNGGTSAIIFRVTGVPMPVQSITFIGASAIPEKDLEAAMTEAFGQDFSITRLTDITSKGLTGLFHNKGYWRVEFANITPMLSTTQAGGPADSFPVGAAITIDQGSQYNWSKAVWSGNHAFPTDELDRNLHMQPNEVANEYKIEAGLNAVRMAYLTHGYLDSSVQTKMRLDDTPHLAIDEVTIQEGPQYHMAAVQFMGVPPRLADALAKKWTLKPGDVFDPTYSQTFIDTVAGHEIASQGLRLTRATIRQQTNKTAHTVSLALVFQ